MAFLDAIKYSEKIFLPSRNDRPEDEKIWVILKDQYLAEDLDRVMSALEPSQEPDAATITLAGMISDWNIFEAAEPDDPDQSPKKMKINAKSVGKLQAQDKIFLKDHLQVLLGIITATQLDDEQKKTSGVTLTPPTMQPMTQTPSVESQEAKTLP